jgi:hypothetical protein
MKTSKTTNQQKNNIILHGECTVFRSKIPKGAKKMNVKDDYLVVAPSETVGNHHVVDNVEGVTFYKLDDILFMENTKQTQIRCLHKDRHSAITLDAGTWQFGVQKEYDYFTEQLRAVRD